MKFELDGIEDERMDDTPEIANDMLSACGGVMEKGEAARTARVNCNRRVSAGCAAFSSARARPPGIG
jgi:hypothetical protein